MRTPLNIACVGLEALREALYSHRVFICDVTNIMEDIQSSCKISVNILDDMLTCDKLECGMMSLDLGECSVWASIKEAIQPFFRKVKMCLCHVSVCAREHD